MQAMQEYEVTAQGNTYFLDKPFFVLATQNPVEQAGTYPLPEAQLDRFMFKVLIDYLPEEQEIKVVDNTTRVLSDEETLAWLETVLEETPPEQSIIVAAHKPVATVEKWAYHSWDLERGRRCRIPARHENAHRAQGEDRRFDQNEPLGEVQLTELRSARRGDLKIEVTFMINIKVKTDISFCVLSIC